MATVVDDTSPLIGWFGSTWSPDPASHSDDPSTNQYFNSPHIYEERRILHHCMAWHGSVSLRSEKGKGIYGVSVDGGNTQYYSGYSADGQFGQVLYATSGMSEGDHQIKISNENSRNTEQYPTYIWLDIDKVAFTGTLMNAGGGTPASADSTTSSTQSSPSTSSSASVTQSSPTSTSSPSSSNSITSSSAVSTITSSGSISATGFTSIGLYTAKGTSMSIASTQTGQPTSSPRTETTGEPNIPNASSNAESDSSGTSSSSHKTTVIAISVTVIVIAAVVIATVLGLVWWRRRRRLREEDEQEADYLAPQSSWR